MRDYLIVAPCRNEGKFARKTLDSLVNQTITPKLLVVVDDGSSDDTPEILAEYAEKHDWIKIVRREDRGKRSVGPGVIDAFYAGLQTVDIKQFDYVCKLDLDLVLPDGYFEGLIRRMEADPRIGTCSGKAYFINEAGQQVSEGIADDVSVGASKFYRRPCFEQIGGFVRQVMWDGIDNHRCRMLGWIPCSWDDEDIRFIHLRPMGSSQKGILTGRMRWGYGQYFMGTSLAYMTASAIFRMRKPPVIMGGLAIWWGFVWSMIKRKERYGDPEFCRFVRKCQWSFLIKGKKTAVKQINQQQATAWKPASV